MGVRLGGYGMGLLSGRGMVGGGGRSRGLTSRGFLHLASFALLIAFFVSSPAPCLSHFSVAPLMSLFGLDVGNERVDFGRDGNVVK